MAIRPIIKYPASSLRVPTALVPLPRPVYPESFADQVQDMRDTLRAGKDGLAISHNQVFEHGLRAFLVDTRMIEFPEELIINPNWKPEVSSKLETKLEGCLSFPGISVQVIRYTSIVMEYQDMEGNIKQTQCEGLAARMVQHECDHLDGKLFIEYAPKKQQIDVRNEVIRRRKAGRW